MSDGGKGSTPRPLSVSQAEYESRWDAIFGRDVPQQLKPKDELAYWRERALQAEAKLHNAKGYK